MLFRLTLCSVLALACGPLYAGTYTLEPDYTQVVVRWSHLGFSNPAAQFAQGHGTLHFDAATPDRDMVEVTVPVESMVTGVPGLDEHLRSSDFFDLAHFPTATFRSTRVEQQENHRLKVTGNLELHGVTRPVTLDVVIVKIGTNPRTQLPTIGFEATATLKRSEFGLGRFVPQVSDDIDMHITSQAVDAVAYASYLKAQETEAATKDSKK
jgi:polyisoprenoid-binding protein YceI